MTAQKSTEKITALAARIDTIIADGDKDAAALTKEVEKAREDRDTAARDMDSAINTADRDAYNKAAARKNKAEDTIYWDERRLDILKNKALAEPAEIKQLADDLQGAVDDLDAETMEKARPLLVQLFKLADDAATIINTADAANVRLRKNIEHQEMAGPLYQYKIYDATKTSDLRNNLAFVKNLIED